MKKCIPLLILALVLCGCGKKAPENPYRLKTQTNVRYYDTEESERSVTYFYDAQGRISHYEADDGDITRHTYDEYGNLIRSVTQGPDGTDVTAEYILTLDGQHRPIRSEHHWNAVHQSTSISSYDRYGNVIQLDVTFYRGDTATSSRISRKYDWDGNLLREETIKSSGDSDGYTIYEYEHGRLHYSGSYDGDGVLQRCTHVLWDEATRTETRNSYLADGSPDGHTVSYWDEFGNCLKTEYYNGPGHPIGGGDDRLDHMVSYTYERIPE